MVSGLIAAVVAAEAETSAALQMDRFHLWPVVTQLQNIAAVKTAARWPRCGHGVFATISGALYGLGAVGARGALVLIHERDLQQNAVSHGKMEDVVRLSLIVTRHFSGKRAAGNES